jgi:ribosomal 50S subunit-associated protein YjgA (DUF615 family)
MGVRSAEDAAAAAAERRWFASMRAVRAMQTECETLRDLLETVEGAWRRARAELAQLEALRDALGDELELSDWDAREGLLPSSPGRAMNSAA